MANKKALLVLDMQEICVGENHAKFFKYDDDLLRRVNEVIEQNDAVIYIRTVMKNNLINRLSPVRVFDGAKEAELAECLKKKGNAVFDKYRGDAFSNPELLSYLRKHGIGSLELVGIDGAGCVALTAFSAIENGFDVSLNTKAIDTMFKKKMDKRFKCLGAKGVTIVR